ncbi:MAG: TIGR03985 family CRISPR-associated protein [Hydrococcus sp. SU_1_0]|nr:TIGR03985 family CRISPR-associated protein [Hydrococcus sp. SU_1_0]
MNGIQRLYIHTDYIVKGEAQDKVGELIETLKNLWQKNEVFLIKFTYDSASLYHRLTCIVYPICIRYIRRALYLSAYGQIKIIERKKNITYKNYRLDRISKLEIIDWNSLEVPDKLRTELSIYQQEKYSLEYIINNSAKALGADFYQPIATMLLRFSRDFHELYIENTLRHETFKLVDINNSKSLDKLFTELKLDVLERQKLQTKINLFLEDAYYQLNYRVNDNDVIMRLRAWGANVEVLYPQNLRDRMIKDISDNYAVYQ